MPIVLGPFHLDFTVNAEADADMTTVHVRDVPTIETSWSGVTIFPRDSDGSELTRRSLSDSSEKFAVELYESRTTARAACKILPAWPDLMTDCIVPDVDSTAGDWNLIVTFSNATIHASSVRVLCGEGT